MRMKFLAALAVAGGLALGASQAQATTFTGSWSLDYHTSGDGLLINIQTLNPTFNFSLAPNNPATPQNEEIKKINLFKIYTPEDWVNPGEDDVGQAIKLTFNFTAPTPNTVDPIDGTTTGYSELLGFYQGGKLTWANNGVTQLHYGNGLTGLMTISVNGGTFSDGSWWTGPDEGPSDALKVSATFDWDRDPTAVPEPATWALMIGGFGMAGATLRRRRALTA
ncbi:PEPxxWA-CTERM sorting domain-containing protein [Phenylobacterium sp.]|uniref:PEPxxWA-CTERM sorting domain-containing protein n=1 Tax=Phenylobacterium sp. TaxID=1871053 RepID=UPI0025D85ECF|nr:PEPxxWA-CTERM sorting domain-containing protein [Phenylobacterium sp.]